MAKNDNLQDFLIDVADAIRAKKGTTDKINPQDFSSEIASIQSGVEPKEMKDVNFYDYDGTILHSYSWDEALQLTEMPPLPSHDGLICQGWNWTLEEMQANEGMCDVGAMYITDDGRTRLYIDVEDDETEDDLSIDLYFSNTNTPTIKIYWGDKTEETYEVTTNTFYTHKYSSKGKYVIEIKVLNNSLYIGQTNIGLCGSNYIKSRKVQKIELGNNIVLTKPKCLQHLLNLYAITIPIDVVIGTHANCFVYSQLRHISFPPNMTDNVGGFEGCVQLATISFSPNMKRTVGLTGPFALKRMVFSKGTLLNIGQILAMNNYSVRLIYNITMQDYTHHSFATCRNLTSLPPIEGTPTTIRDSFCANCWSLQKFECANSVTSIAQNAFSNCYSMRYYDFTKLSAVPTLANANAFTGIPANCEIRVPMALVDEWKAATNWSTYADYIVGIETNN